MVQQSIITLALLHEFVYEFIGNNTYIILDRTALDEIKTDQKKRYDFTSTYLEIVTLFISFFFYRG